MALQSLPASGYSLIHHSDRGVQYCSEQYVKLLQDYQIQISMTENGDPKENAIAERINGILKQEYLNYYRATDLADGRILLEKAIELYNTERPHMSNGMLTPAVVHSEMISTNKLWKNYYQKNRKLVKLS
nr:integrase core domain-containing protein [Pedobacter sp. SYSU D00535]